MKARTYVGVAFGALIFVALCEPVSAQKSIGQRKKFPITISKPGSYKLKSNITVPNANTTAISITADNVTIDLNGFSILGPTVCTVGTDGYVTSCTPTGTGNGIDSVGIGPYTGTTVVNGTVQGMGRSGLYLGPGARVEKVRAVSNGWRGIDVFSEATVMGSMGLDNGETGILTGGISVVVNSVAAGNQGTGIGAEFTGTGVVMGNTAERNGGSGFEGGTAFLGNTAEFNFACGINGGPQFGYANNVVFINTFGSVCGGGTDMGGNACNSSTTCP